MFYVKNFLILNFPLENRDYQTRLGGVKMQRVKPGQTKELREFSHQQGTDCIFYQNIFGEWFQNIFDKIFNVIFN